MPKSWKRKEEAMPSRSEKPQPSINDAVEQFFWGSAWYERDRDGYWYLNGGNGIMVGPDRKSELERAWRAEGNIPPPRPEL